MSCDDISLKVDCINYYVVRINMKLDRIELKIDCIDLELARVCLQVNRDDFWCN
jgi:hypothetical protein